MKILLINSVYKVGSTGKIIDCLGEVLRSKGHEVRICYGIGDKHYDKFSIKICSNWEHKLNALLMRIRGIPYGGVFISNRRFYRIIDNFKPDVVHVHCINASMINVYHLFNYLGKKKIKTVVTLHAEIYHTAGCEHAFDCEKFKTGCHNCTSYNRKSWIFERSMVSWQKMFNAFNSFHSDCLSITAVSPWLTKRAEQSAILRKYKVVYVPNGLDTTIFHYYPSKGLIDRGGFQGVILYVTAVFSLNETDQKGGRYIPELARLMPQYKFVVVASQSSVASFERLPYNVQFWGRAQSQYELAQLYSEADVTLILSRREAFSMVTAESLCCGTSVVGFKAGGPESIVISDYFSFVEYGNISALAESLDQRLKMNNDRDSLSGKAAKLYARERPAELYIDIYDNLISKKC